MPFEGSLLAGAFRVFAAGLAAFPIARTGLSRLLTFSFPSSATLGFVKVSRCTGAMEGLKLGGGFGSCEPFVLATVPGFASVGLLLT